ncbi:RluA family pseudouridine synthase [Bacteroidota bacterium]
MTDNLKILYEDDEIISLDKPAGIASAHEKESVTLLLLLEKKYEEKFFVVHRLDKDVSGVILFAKNENSHRYLSKLFEEKKVDKTYIALVHGLIENEKGIIDKPIRQFGSGRMGIDEQNGKESITKYRILKRSKRFSQIEIKLITGRRHQIRVHLYSIGHPIVGDPLYGDRSIQKQYPRLMLHACEIRFTLQSGKEIKIKSELPNLSK